MPVHASLLSLGLFLCSLHGHTDIVHELLGMGADPDARTRTGRSSLSYAASSGFLSVARALIRGRAFLNPQNSIGETPLFIAASLGHRAVVRELIDKGTACPL